MLRNFFLKRSNTPVNVDSDAAAVLENSARSVKAILDRRQALDRAGMAETPLVLIMGETHACPAHYAHHIAVLNALQKYEKIGVAKELPHDLWKEEFFPLGCGHQSSIDIFKSFDKSGKASLRASFVDIDLKAYHSRKTFENFLLTSDIPVRFTDAAMGKVKSLSSSISIPKFDFCDPSTVLSLRACFNSSIDGISALSAKGMKVRNHHMCNMSIDFARNDNLRILVQRCGNAHVMGHHNWIGNRPARDSLAAFFKVAGYPVLAMPITGSKWFKERAIPRNCGLNEEEKIVLTGISEVTAFYHPQGLSVPSFPSFPSDFKDQDAESAYFNALLDKADMGSLVLSIEDLASCRLKARHSLQEIHYKIRMNNCHENEMEHRKKYPSLAN